VGLEYPVCRKGGALIVADAENLRNLTFEGCTFLAHQTKALYLRRGEGKLLKGSTIVQSWIPTSDKRISLLRNVSVENTNLKRRCRRWREISTFRPIRELPWAKGHGGWPGMPMARRKRQDLWHD